VTTPSTVGGGSSPPLFLAGEAMWCEKIERLEKYLDIRAAEELGDV
jgi:hypothetical protein